MGLLQCMFCSSPFLQIYCFLSLIYQICKQYNFSKKFVENSNAYPPFLLQFCCTLYGTIKMINFHIIGICGELAADITLTEAFLRMGIDELSVSPPFVLKVRDAVRKIDLSK